LHIHPEQGKSYRSGKSFRCGHCGWCGDADYNAAMKCDSFALNREIGG
jgi:transposase